MKKLNKKNKSNSIQTIEAFGTGCVCAGHCSCWNDIFWVGNTSADVLQHTADMSATGSLG